MGAALLTILRSRTAAPPAWAPDDVAGLQLWLDADDTSVLFQNNGGTGAITSSSDPVGYAGDKSGNGRHFTKATPGERPTWQADGLATGHDSLLFDDGDDNLTSSAYSIAGAQTWALTFRLPSTLSSSEIDCILDLSNGSRSAPLLLANFGGYTTICWRFDFTGTLAAVGISPTLDTSVHSLLIVYNGSGSGTPGNYTVYLDGVAQSPSSTGVFVATTATELGRLSSGSFPAGLHLGKIMIWSSALGGTDLSNLQAYLAAAIA